MELTQTISALIEPVLNRSGYALVRVRLTGTAAVKNSLRLQIMAERHDGRPMGIEDCSAISRELSAHLDVADPIDGRYTLEVSSPGLDRPLVRLQDFARFAGCPARLELTVPLNDRKRFTGHAEGIDGDTVIFMDQDIGRLTVPFADIHKAKLLLTNDQPKEKK
jgi:ribosome maturation factor RimP